MTSDNRPDAERSLDIALSVAAEMNRVIAAADAKVGLTLAGQGVVLAGTAAMLRDGRGLPAPATGSTPALTAALTTLALACGSVVLLAAALWPRTTKPSGGTPAFPSLHHGNGIQAAGAPAELAARAWIRADALAGIACRKHGWFRIGLTCGTAAFLTFTSAAVLAAHL